MTNYKLVEMLESTVKEIAESYGDDVRVSAKQVYDYTSNNLVTFNLHIGMTDYHIEVTYHTLLNKYEMKKVANGKENNVKLVSERGIKGYIDRLHFKPRYIG